MRTWSLPSGAEPFRLPCTPFTARDLQTVPGFCGLCRVGAGSPARSQSNAVRPTGWAPGGVVPVDHGVSCCAVACVLGFHQGSCSLLEELCLVKLGSCCVYYALLISDRSFPCQWVSCFSFITAAAGRTPGRCWTYVAHHHRSMSAA